MSVGHVFTSNQHPNRLALLSYTLFHVLQSWFIFLFLSGCSATRATARRATRWSPRSRWWCARAATSTTSSASPASSAIIGMRHSVIDNKAAFSVIAVHSCTEIYTIWPVTDVGAWWEGDIFFINRSWSYSYLGLIHTVIRFRRTRRIRCVQKTYGRVNHPCYQTFDESPSDLSSRLFNISWTRLKKLAQRFLLQIAPQI